MKNIYHAFWAVTVVLFSLVILQFDLYAAGGTAQPNVTLGGVRLVTLNVLEVTVDGDVDLAAANDINSWSLDSSSDPNYGGEVHPVSVDRFTFTLNADNRGTAEDDDINHQTLSDVIRRHQFYLKFADPLKNDNNYKLVVSSLLGISAPQDLLFTAGQGGPGASRAIKINQFGYNNMSAKRYAYVGYWIGTGGSIQIEEPLNFQVYNAADDTEVYSGATSQRVFESGSPESLLGLELLYDPLSGEYVQEIDLSPANLNPGTYYIEVDTIGRSYPFRIGGSAYDVYYTTARGLYHQRCGTSLLSQYTPWARGLDHKYVYKVDVLENWGSFFNELTPTNGVKIKVPGGWHDAGDFDRRPLHAIAVEYLLFLAEAFGDRLGDNTLHIPESGDGLPDVLNEALYGLKLWEILQESDGGVRSGIESYRHPIGGYTSATDPLPYWTYSRNRMASYQFAALAAHALKVLDHFKNDLNPVMLARYNLLKTKAIKAWEWAEENNASIGTTTPYGGQVLSDLERAKMWAATGLFNACLSVEGMPCADKFGTKFFDTLCVYDGSINLTWDEDESRCVSGLIRQYRNPTYSQNIYTIWPLAVVDTSSLHGVSKDAAEYVKGLVVKKIKHTADDIINYTENPLNRYRNALNPGNASDYLGSPSEKPGYPISFGTGSTPAQFMAPVIMAYYLSPEQRYIDIVSLNADYQLGAHPLAQSWISGLGFDTPENPLHLDSMYDNIKQPVPGIPINGPFPNTYAFEDYFQPGHAGDENYFINYWKFFVYYPFYPQATNNFSTTGTPFIRHYSPWTGMAPMNEFTVWGDMDTTTLAFAFLYAVSNESPRDLSSLKPEDYPLNPGYYFRENPSCPDGQSCQGNGGDGGGIPPESKKPSDEVKNPSDSSKEDTQATSSGGCSLMVQH